MENMSQKCVNWGVNQGNDGKCFICLVLYKPTRSGKFTNVAFTIFANRPFAMLSTLMQKLLYTRRFSYLNPFRKSEILELGKGLMIAHFYDMFAVRKFVPTIPFLRPVLIGQSALTITISNSN